MSTPTSTHVTPGATELPWDLRKSQPYLGYETYDFDVPTVDSSDTYGRYIVRIGEVEQSLRIVEQVLDRLGQAYVAIESPKGELGCHVVSDGGTRPYRAHLRDPSFHHMQAVSVLCEGGNLADVIPAIASIDPVIGGVDR